MSSAIRSFHCRLFVCFSSSSLSRTYVAFFFFYFLSAQVGRALDVVVCFFFFFLGEVFKWFLVSPSPQVKVKVKVKVRRKEKVPPPHVSTKSAHTLSLPHVYYIHTCMHIHLRVFHAPYVLSYVWSLHLFFFKKKGICSPPLC